MSDGSGALGPLLERGREAAVITAALDAARSESGGVVLLRGSAGVGKSELLRLARRRAREAGMQVVAARGGPLERDFAFGVVRQLFEPLVARARASARRSLLDGAAHGALDALTPEPPAAPPGGAALSRTMHGLYWLCSNAAERAPLLALIDDAHWADAESLRWMSYMAHRVIDLPVLLIATTRPGEASVDGAALADLGLAPRIQAVDVPPLSGRGSAALVRRIRGQQAAVEFCEACHHATGGNPYHLRELLAETVAQDMAPSAAEAVRVAHLGPPAIASAALVRIARLSPACVRLARAVAVLGLDTPVRDAAALAGIETGVAQLAADELASAGILQPQRPLNFEHPVVAAAIYRDLPAGARSQAHRKAAGLLAAQGAEPGRPAAHLLRVDPAREPFVLETLRAAASDAVQRGAPATAAAYLTRALCEAAGMPERPDVLRELGRAELTAGRRKAIEHLTEAIRTSPNPDVIADAAVLAGGALQAANRFGEAREVLQEARRRLGDSADAAQELRLASVQMQRASCDPEVAGEIASSLPRWLSRAAQAGPDGASMLTVAALGLAVRGEDPGRVSALLETAFGRGDAIGPQMADSIFPAMALTALTAIDDLAHADELLTGLFDDARARGSVLAYVTALVWRGYVTLRRGLPAAAEADERAAADLAGEHALDFMLPWAQAFLTGALLDRGAVDSAADAADALVHAETEAPSVAGYMLDARGRVRVAQGRIDQGVADVLAAGAAHGSLGGTSPNILHWRSSAALALGRDDPRARELAGDELESARALGFPRGLGVALRTSGILDPTDDGLERLKQAAAVLDGSPARLEHARALCALGGALRRRGRRAESREPLRHALALADELRAEALAHEAQAELAATGARPRRRQLSGADALTPTERRVAELAASGLGNRDIAQALFVSRKTIEMHLGHTYRKLDIGSREELAAALAPPDEQAAPESGPSRHRSAADPSRSGAA